MTAKHATQGAWLLLLSAVFAACDPQSTASETSDAASMRQVDAGSARDAAPGRDTGGNAIPADASAGADLRQDGGPGQPDVPPGGSDAGRTQPDARAACALDTDPMLPMLLRQKLGEFSGETPVTIDGQTFTIRERYSDAGRAQARAFLKREFQALGFVAREQAYASGVNVIFDRPGRDDQVLIVGAHYDTVTDYVPGADDDGSGVISSWAIARALGPCQLAHGLRVLAFDGEESGMLGSRQYVAAHADERANWIGAVVLEMTGYDADNDGSFNVIDCPQMQDNGVLLRALPDATSFSLRRVDACTDRSDHAPFWSADVPAIVLSQLFFAPGGRPEPNPCYHRECDTVDRINFPYMARLARFATAQVAALLDAR